MGCSSKVRFLSFGGKEREERRTASMGFSAANFDIHATILLRVSGETMLSIKEVPLLARP